MARFGSGILTIGPLQFEVKPILDGPQPLSQTDLLLLSYDASKRVSRFVLFPQGRAVEVEDSNGNGPLIQDVVDSFTPLEAFECPYRDESVPYFMTGRGHQVRRAQRGSFDSLLDVIQSLEESGRVTVFLD